MSAISDKAMLVRLSISQWSARKLDRRVTDAVNREHGASPDAGRYNKALVAREALQAVAQAATAARTYYYANTLPWSDAGARILPSAHFWEFSAEMRALETRWRDAVAEFVGGYPAYVEQARARLNGMFDPADYPAPDDVSGRFAWAVDYDPVPDGGDFRVDLGDDERARIAAQIEQRAEAATAEAMRDLWRRLYEVVSKAAGALGEPDRIFRDSLIGNVRELCGLLPALNVAGDAELEQMRQRVERALAGRQPAELRNNPAERAEAARAAADIASAMGAFMGGEVQHAGA